MDQYLPQEEVRRIIISDMVKKRNSIVPDPTFTSIKKRVYYGLSPLSQYSFGVPLVLLGLSHRALKWIRRTFEDGSKVMLKYTLLTNIGDSMKSNKNRFYILTLFQNL